MIELTVESADFARGLNNALAHVPAASRIPFVYLTTDPASSTLTIVGTDSYTAGMEVVPFTRYKGPAGPAEFLLDRGKADSGATLLEKTVRLAGKGPCDTVFKLADLEAAPMGGDLVSVPIVHRPELFDLYRNARDYIEHTEDKRTDRHMLDPALWMRFSKVKTDKTYGRMADILLDLDGLNPWLIKIGPNFRGVIMPIDRQVNGQNEGEDGLW